ncbi:unnamed protein product [Urochloa decumbens]|uniref:Protein kinase domain-containing protein n=1 Tax=Urochloa decumbens TaxID=240449 RepID=A0ABC9AVJ8_9POAL
MGAKWQSVKIFTEDDIKRITSNYSTPIGEGGFGVVYKGILDDDCDLVAVKRYIRADLKEEFMEEVNIHSQMGHKNVVRLIGYCIGESTLTLVTEYITKGNLDHILHSTGTSIPLDKRLGIAIGCAEALNYMHSIHSLSDALVFHGDIKPANILLDDNLTTKVSDFGLSRLLSSSITRYTMTVRGTIDYMDPVYLHEGRLTTKSDVYSFGIVLLELIARQRVRQGDINLIGTFKEAFANGNEFKKIVDTAIANENSFKILKETGKLAIECLTLDVSKRPQMNDVLERLQMLKKILKGKAEDTRSILSTHHAWLKNKSPSFLKRNASNSKILLELSNIRKFTTEELNEVTENYSYLLGGDASAKFYKGTLEDNTVVVVRKFLCAGSEEAIISGGVILSQIFHKNIIKLFGCCMESETLILVYENMSRGSLQDILGKKEDFPLEKRMRIAIKTAEALEYLHSSATGIIGHGNVATSTILLDNNFLPKLSDFSSACMLIKESETTTGDRLISRVLLGRVLNDNPCRYSSVLLKLENDVYRFGGVLFALISREKNIRLDDLVDKFTKSYQINNSGEVMFDKDITNEEDITVLEDIGRLALKCTILNADEMVMRPTMKEVAEQLNMIRRSWKECPTKEATYVSETEGIAVMSAEPRLPNMMRHLFGYRHVSTSDPIRTC